LALANLIPIDLRIKEIAEVEETKIKRNVHSLPADRLYQQRVPFTHLGHPAHRHTLEWINIETPVEAINFERTAELSVYTDGSKLEGRVGAAFTALGPNISSYNKTFKLEDYNSVFQAELIAIRESLILINKRKPQTANILSDSLSALMAIANTS